MNKDKRLPASAFRYVTEDHIWRAVVRLSTEKVNHSFAESTDYDVIADNGKRLPPKAVFGVAATEALGFELRPHNFRGGKDTMCFKAIKKAGFLIVPKYHEFEPAMNLSEADGRIWEEGGERYVFHRRLERGSGLSHAKKRQFRKEHGKLFCEECKIDPQEIYGIEVGEACIEVHHILPLSKTRDVRETNLDDLICVCANCHRMIHHKLRNNLP